MGSWPLLVMADGLLLQTESCKHEGSRRLNRCCLAGQLEEAVALIESGVDINATNPRGQTALMSACSNGETEVVSMLLSRGCTVNSQDKVRCTPLCCCCLSYSKFKNGRSALHAACACESADIVFLLLRHGARTDALDNVRSVLVHLG